MASNRPEHVIVDVGVMLAGGTPVSIYNTLAPEQTQYVAGDASVKVAVVEAEFADKWRAIRHDLPDLHTLVLIDAEPQGDGEVDYDDLITSGSDALKTGQGEFENAWRSVGPEDIATIIYTSGTTGPPKGVTITHKNILFLLGNLPYVLDTPQGMRGISYLPLAHIAERMLTHYLAMQKAAQIEYIRDPKLLLGTLVEHRPEVVLAVPRVWEKLQSGILAALEAEDERRKKLVLAAIANGKEVVRARQQGRKAPLGARIKHVLAEKVIFTKLRHKLGLDQCQIPISGAAPLAPELMFFFAALGLEIIEAYGMTETTAVISASRPGRVRFEAVGEPLPAVEVKIAEDGEILARGPNLTPGYLNRPDATAELIDDEGWLHTGDLGKLEGTYLSVVGRKKELIITAGGKNLSPNNIEETIKSQSEIIAQVCAVGDNRPFISALVILDGDLLPLWCYNHGIEWNDFATAAEHPDVLAEVERAMKAGNEHLARVEQVKQWTVLTSDWTPESDEMTPTMKLKRAVIHDKYSDVIDGMYGGD
jgi:long-chain acyl-CoA synthetase